MSGVIQASSSLHLTVESCSVFNSSAKKAAPLNLQKLLASSTVNITGSTFVSTNGLNGGAIGITNSTSNVSISNCVFSGSYASSGGGIFLSYASNVRLEGNTFRETSATDGGAIFIDHSQQIGIRNCLFESVSAANGGGIKINTFSASINIEASVFRGGESSVSGGAIMIVSGNSQIAMNNVKIYNSSARTSGGGIFIGSANNDLQLVIVTVNQSVSNGAGGALYIDEKNTEIYLALCVFDGNRANDGGGAIFVNEENANIYVIGSLLSNNVANTRGGGMMAYENNYRIVSTDFQSFIQSGQTRLEPYGGSTTLTNAFSIPAETLAVIISFDRESSIDQVGYTGQAVVSISLKCPEHEKSLLNTRLDSFPGVHYPSLYVPIDPTAQGSCQIITSYAMPATNPADYKPNGILVYIDVALNSLTTTIAYPTVFLNNVAALGSGGGFLSYYSNSFISLINTQFIGNHAVGPSSYGGGAYFWLVNNGFSLIGSNFTFNNASLNGGALALMSANAGGAIRKCNFISNNALLTSSVGGSIFASNSNGQGSFSTQNPIVMEDTVVSKSSAAFGGGIGLESRNVFTLTNVQIDGNVATDSGGGIYSQLSNLITIANSFINANEAASIGGGMYLEDQNNVTITASTFTDNVANSLGGGLAISGGSSVAFSNVNQFESNSAAFGGGAIYVSSAAVWTMSAAALVVEDNEAPYGSAIYLVDIDAASGPIVNCTLSNNVALFGGTIYWVYYPEATMPTISSASVRYTSNYVGYGEVATQVVSLISSSSYSVEAYGTALNPPISIYAADFYGQRVIYDTTVLYTIKSLPSADGLNCSSLQPSLTAANGTSFFVMNGVVQFNGVSVYCYPQGAMKVSIATEANTPVIPSSVLPYLSKAMPTTDMVLTFRACIVGERLVSGQCLACPSGSYTFQAGTEQCTSCIATSGLDNCFADDVYVSPGFWRRTNYTETVLECPLGEQSCVGGWKTGDAMCGAGYTGPLCSVCASGYYSSNGGCVACSSSGQVSTLVVVVVVLVLALALLFYCYRIYQFVNKTVERTTKALKRVTELQVQLAMNEVDISTIQPEDLDISLSSTEFLCLWVRKKVQTIMVKVKILTATLQVITTCAVVFSVTFPPAFSRFTDSFQFINLNVYSVLPLGCGKGTFDFMSTLLWSTLGPIVVMGLVSLGLAVLYRRKERGELPLDVWRTWRSRGISVYFYLSYLVLPSVSVTIFQTFICQNVDPNGEDANENDWFLTADMSISCSSPYYKSWRAYAIFMIFVYPIGIPLSYLVMLYKRRKEISTRDLATLPDDSEFIGITGAIQVYAEMILEYVTGIESQATKKQKKEQAAEDEEKQKQQDARGRSDSLSTTGENGGGGGTVSRPMSDRLRSWSRADSTRSRADSMASLSSGVSSRVSINVSRRNGSKTRRVPITAESLGLEVETSRELSSKATALAFLWAAYEPQYWYWDVVEATRRIILTAVLSVIAPGTSSQNVLALLMSLLFIKLYGLYKPYVSDDDDTLAELGQFQIFFTYLAAMTQQNNLLPPVYDNLVGGLLILINILLPCVALHFEVSSYYEEKHKQEATTGEFSDDAARPKSPPDDGGESSAYSWRETLEDMWKLLVTDFLFGGAFDDSPSSPMGGEDTEAGGKGRGGGGETVVNQLHRAAADASVRDSTVSGVELKAMVAAAPSGTACRTMSASQDDEAVVVVVTPSLAVSHDDIDRSGDDRDDDVANRV
eukprot:gene6925-4991_t